MPRIRQPTRTLTMTAEEVKTLEYLLNTGAMSEMPQRWAGNARRMLSRLEGGDEPNIQRMLDVSTGHLTDEERDHLGDGAIARQAATYDYGGIVHVGVYEDCEADNSDALPAGTSPTLAAIMRHAIARGCGYVIFDADAPPLPGFPILAKQVVA